MKIAAGDQLFQVRDARALFLSTNCVCFDLLVLQQIE